jgi:heme/copper-type cytochrome/quinol oxidase subunit 3
MTELEPFGLGGGVGVMDPPRERPKRRRVRPSRTGGEPPESGHGGGGGGGGGGGDGDEGPPPGEDGAERLGVTFLLVGVSILFIVFLGAFLSLRANAEELVRRGDGLPPSALWGSTLLIVASSLALTRASRLARNADPRAARAWIAATFALGVLFLVVQLRLASSLIDAGLTPSSGAYGAIFYALVGMHLVHVFAGLSLLARAWQCCAPAGARPVGGLALTSGASYWHLLTAIWGVVFCALTFG